VINAIIKENKPFCPMCENRNYKISDYKEIEHESKSYTQFIARCKCGNSFKYCAKILVKEEKYFIFNDEKEIKGDSDNE